jgi:hypothetical protein
MSGVEAPGPLRLQTSQPSALDIVVKTVIVVVEVVVVVGGCGLWWLWWLWWLSGVETSTPLLFTTRWGEIIIAVISMLYTVKTLLATSLQIKINTNSDTIHPD